MDKFVKFSAILSMLIIALSISYYLVVFIPSNEERKENQKIETTAQNKIDLDECIKKAKDKRWEYLELNGTKNKDGSISTPTKISDNANKVQNDEIAFCYKRYPIN